MTPASWIVRRLHVVDHRQRAELAAVLVDCVAGGASVSFMSPLSHERAMAFWNRVADDVAAGRRALVVAEDALGICGTVQLVIDQPENQPHRADVENRSCIDGRAARGSERPRCTPPG